MFIARRKADQNKATVDPWTLVHLAAGLSAGLAKLPPGWALLAAVAYEAGEQVFERTEFGQRFFAVSGPETFSNSVFDLAVFVAGQWLGRRWNET